MIRFRRKGKYGATRARCGQDHEHDSKLEAAVCNLLHWRKRAGEVGDIKLQDTVKLTRAQVGYRPDFRVQDLNSGELVWIEAKGLETPVFKIQKRLWKVYGPGRLEIWKGTWQRPTLSEVVEVRHEG